MKVNEAIDICNVSNRFVEMMDAFSNDLSRLDYDPSQEVIGQAIYYHVCTMKYAGWKHRINFNRYIKHSMAEMFQDLIAFYLKRYLPTEYDVMLEKKVDRTRPDIIIKKDGVNHFIIEVKTTIGWNRNSFLDYDKEDNPIKKRIRALAQNFNISESNIIYIFEEHSNVRSDFSDKYWDKVNNSPRPHPHALPYSFVYPLFNESDPYYWKYVEKFSKDESFPEITEEEILKKAQVNVVTPFETILKLIENS